MLKKLIGSFVFAALAIGLILVGGCQRRSPATAKPTVLVSIPPYAYFAERIGGTEIQVISLVPENANPHIYEPKPQQIHSLNGAQLWCRLGDPADQKIYSVLKEQNPNLIIVEMTKGIELLSTCDEDDSHHCDEEGKDLHIWLSPRLMKKQAETIAQGLIQAFPENQISYRERLQAVLRELDQLDQEITALLAPRAGDAILVSHPAFAYFCLDYHLVQLSIETEGKDPLPQQITSLLAQAKQHHVTAVLLQPQYSNKGATLIAKQLSLPVATVNPYAADYMENLRLIAQVIAQPG
jgi:zinc transport system substrate-binding protein